MITYKGKTVWSEIKRDLRTLFICSPFILLAWKLGVPEIGIFLLIALPVATFRIYIERKK